MIYNSAPEGPAQRSEQWYLDRLGVITGSRVINTLDYAKPTVAIMKKADDINQTDLSNDPTLIRLREEYPFEYVLRAGLELSRNGKGQTMLRDLTGERLTHLSADPEGFTSYDMKWGTVSESTSKMQYQLRERKIVLEMPLIKHPTLEWCAVSPDGAIKGENGGLEMKNPRTGTHLNTLKSELIEDEFYRPEEYYAQVQLEIDVNEWDWVDFVSHDSRLPKDLQYMCHRIYRDNFYITEIMHPAIKRFNAEVEKELEFFAKYRKMLFARAAAKKKEVTDATVSNPRQQPETSRNQSENVEDQPQNEVGRPYTTPPKQDESEEIWPSGGPREAKLETDSIATTIKENAVSAETTISSPVSSDVHSENQPAPELDDNSIYADITDDELREDIKSMFEFLKMSQFDQRRTIRDVSGKITIERLKRSDIIALHKKLDKWIQTINDSDVVEAPKGIDQVQAIFPGAEEINR